MRNGFVVGCFLAALAVPDPAARAQPSAADTSAAEAPRGSGPCTIDAPGLVWGGSEPTLSVAKLAALAAPVFWFSPDEPGLNRARGEAIRIPEPFLFETPSEGPVVYYQVEEVMTRGDSRAAGYVPNPNPGEATLNLSAVAAIRLSYFAYFTTEEGLGAHPHDIEPVEYMLVVARSTDSFAKPYLKGNCRDLHHAIVVTRVTGKAHGLNWYWNILEVDKYTEFPMHLLVEEGKHALATDKNADGYFTPGFDVNQRINDAWGVRDVIREGMLFSGGYEAWMSKVRRPEHRVLPPLPEDSPLQPTLTSLREESPAATYSLRPFPKMEAAGDDHVVQHLMKDKVRPEGPDIHEAASLARLGEWVGEGRALKSLSIAFRADGDLGFSFVFPFFIVKNLEDPLSGGFIVHRMYLKDHNDDFGWMIMYTPSASRWIDTYLAAGVEWDQEGVDSLRVTSTDFVLETGLKFRVNVMHSPAKFLGFLTEFWGFRAGIKNTGFFDIDRLTYVLEVGAGVW